jgi:predicted dehydrogenase
MREAVASRQHVLCEKPFLLDHLILDEVRALRDRYDLAVMPVHNWKYAPIIRAATDQLRQGTIGELCEAEITTLRLRDAIAADPAQPSWRRDPILAGGGILMDHGWHALYLALDFFRDGPIETSATLHRPNETAVEDEARVELQFPSGTARIELSWNAPVRANRVKLIGTRGAIVIDDDTLDLNGKKSRFPAGLSAGSHHAEWFTAMLPDVIAAFDKPELSRVPFEEAALCLTIIQRCYAEAGARPNDR